MLRIILKIVTATVKATYLWSNRITTNQNSNEDVLITVEAQTRKVANKFKINNNNNNYNTKVKEEHGFWKKIRQQKNQYVNMD